MGTWSEIGAWICCNSAVSIKGVDLKVHCALNVLELPKSHPEGPNSKSAHSPTLLEWRLFKQNLVVLLQGFVVSQRVLSAGDLCMLASAAGIRTDITSTTGIRLLGPAPDFSGFVRCQWSRQLAGSLIRGAARYKSSKSVSSHGVSNYEYPRDPPPPLHA